MSYTTYLSSITDTATTITYTLSLHDALPIFALPRMSAIAQWPASGCSISERGPVSSVNTGAGGAGERASNSVRQGARSEEHTSELQSHVNLVCRLLLEKKKI